MFFPPRYIIRVLKATLYIILIFALVLLLMYFLPGQTKPESFWELIPQPIQMFGFFLLFGIAYPLVSFVKKSAMLKKSFSEERINIINIFEVSGYELTTEKDGILIFRLKNRFNRFMRLLFEDAIEVEYKDGNVVLSGLRRDVYRLVKHIEYLDK
ncbi:MAG: hypothetical protein LBR10_09260 [Prevotellaceae bacterium]|jgi:hypothetical protein|nr:hypothetical protein [Prevotellaceae bacterium]